MPNLPPIRALLFTLAIAACTPTFTTAQTRPQPQSLAEITFITDVLNTLQPRSIAENREYCGYLGLDPSGAFIISKPKRGGNDGCRPDEPPASMRLLASYHTHAAYGVEYDSEVPSYNDLEADIYEGIDGYIATPGGRIWFNDASAAQASMLCGLTCITADPNFRPEPQFRVLNRYTLDGLRDRQDYLGQYP